MRDVVKQNVSRHRTGARGRRRERSHKAYIILVLILVLFIGVALSMTLFFNVTNIVVYNETDTPDETVAELSGIKYQDNLMRLDKALAAERIRQSIPYAEHVTVEKQLPSTVVIRVEKAVPVANISQSYGYLLVSASNRVLEELKGEPRAGLLIVTGYNPVFKTVGMTLESEDEKRDNVLKTMTAAVTECNDERIISIDMTDQSNILVQFSDNVVFHMGSSVDAVYKLRLAAKTIEQINPEKKYSLTMVGTNQISVRPADSPPLRRETTTTTATTTGTTFLTTLSTSTSATSAGTSTQTAESTSTASAAAATSSTTATTTKATSTTKSSTTLTTLTTAAVPAA